MAKHRDQRISGCVGNTQTDSSGYKLRCVTQDDVTSGSRAVQDTGDASDDRGDSEICMVKVGAAWLGAVDSKWPGVFW
jgi:hypothetical protein